MPIRSFLKKTVIVLLAFAMLACQKTPAPVINIKTSSIEIDYRFTPVSISYSIDFADEGELTAENTARWIHNITVEENVISLVADENDTERLRSAIITLKYPGAESVAIQIIQSYAISKVLLTPSSTEFEYSGGRGFFTYIVENKRDGVDVTVHSDNLWIADVVKTEEGVSYTVAENNAGAQRTGEIVVSYGSYAQSEYIITQKWSAPTITFIPSSAEFEYQGGAGSFTFKIYNPRNDVVTTVKSNCTWITDVVKTDNIVNFRVAENNDGSQRIGKIIVSYGTFVQSEYIVSQKWTAPAIMLTPSSTEFDYSGGTGAFTFMIDNHRSGTDITVKSDCSWVTDIRNTENGVSFSVSENNDGSYRTGKIVLSYGSYTQSEFIINQKWAASTVTLTPPSAEFDYSGGTGSLTFIINNPRKKAEVFVTSNCIWINNTQKTDNNVSYSVMENNSGSQRTGKIVVSYGSYAQAEYIIYQKWAAPIIVLTPSSAEFDYYGGTGTFVVDVKNPRQGGTLSFNNQYDWITNVVQNPDGICYSVMVNYSGLQRKKEITISYGNNVSTYYSIVQRGHPITSIVLDKSSINLLVGDNDNIKVVSVNPDDSELIWSSSDATVATVDAKGLVRAIKSGECMVTVRSSSGGEMATCAVCVKNLEGGNEGIGEIVWK
jgi:hypothetical protein